ncbi:5-oxoprolinase isoform X2 [Anopheles coustani]|uniref:5-oxoprolinase isoform X2 n=1 Tax=Anopheles coustani TaxID=139045 RepID=UPI00265AC41A|nr:5-oxoprolinase isoform X2 [Anopheles coustani]
MASGKYNFAIDRGGTFTDVLCITPDGTVRTLKLLSEDPANYPDAPTEGIRRILQQETGRALTPDGLIDTGLIGWVRMGTTVATNALLERAGDPVALVVNRGFRDLLQIGNQARPNIFQLNIKKPTNLYREVIEIDARLVPGQEGICQLGEGITGGWRRLTGASDATYLEMIPLDEVDLRAKLTQVLASGTRSLAIVLAHSYACPEHELRVGSIAREMGFQHVTLSHEAMPMCRLVARGFTACAEAYLTPHVERYLDGFRAGFRDQLRGAEVLFMQSDGGLTRMENFRGARAILSGPAGGVVGYAVTGVRDATPPLIGFDMGGTSTDVSRYAGSYEHVIESTTAGVTIQAPQLDINTVAAGGGSRLFFRSGLFVVGPESAGAHPGPACYRKGGPLTVTDANLILGRLLPEYFPAIFGPDENEHLDYNASRSAFEALREEINEHLATDEAGTGPLTLDEVAMGFVRVANEAMCRPIRALTQARGYDTARHVLACFGGAGGQHACAIARQLGMRRVVIHKYAGILSAYGMALADVVHEAQEPCGLELCPENRAALKERLHALSARCVEQLESQGFALANDGITLEPYLHLRYEGTDCALMCTPDRVVENADHTVYGFGDFGRTFRERYRSEFGFVLEGRRILVEDIRVRGCGRATLFDEPDIPAATGPIYAEKTTVAYFEGVGRQVTPVYDCAKLRYGHTIDGPAIVIDRLSTIVIEPGSQANVTRRGDLVIEVDALVDESAGGGRKIVDERLDAVQLSIFNHRFMSIAEQMGRVLQRTAISTNIKERLDFSCALFGPDGGLVSNAPHIPVHLGAMQETVQYQLRVRGGTLKPGDVLLSNHPQAGGSHLPDLTVITPVFAGTDDQRPVFFVASRGHHADIGGITPGSMPPHSTSLDQEGAAFKSFLLVDGGVFQEAAIVQRLTSPSPTSGAPGTRNLSDNLSDLRAQIAANQKGIQLVSELINAYGLSVVQAYMGHMQANAELAVRDMLKAIARETLSRTGRTVLEAEEHMDDGTPIRLIVQIDADRGSAVCDFTGTGSEVAGNCNAPRAITLSALIYCLRCMVGHDVPLNQGCLAPIEVRVPPGSILDPSEGAAVVGGNVLTSQRVVDTVFAAFGTCAASQGCMNNVTIGDEGWGYYETVAGGSGAGPGWHGTGGVHTHMTNTRITDPEILELRYPIILRRFTLRDDASGGRGRWRGGDGVHRELLFRKPLMLSVLTERRTLRPYGMAGGGPGKAGLNLLLRVGDSTGSTRPVNIGAKAAIQVRAGDVFSMKTPGGGGYGAPEDEEEPVRGVVTLATDGYNHPLAPSSKAFIERGSVYEYRMAQESV